MAKLNNYTVTVIETEELDQLKAENEKLKERCEVFKRVCYGGDFGKTKATVLGMTADEILEQMEENEALKKENEKQKEELKAYKTMEAFKDFTDATAKMAKKMEELNTDKKEEKFEKGGFLPSGHCGPTGHDGEVILTPEQQYELKVKCLEHTRAMLKK